MPIPKNGVMDGSDGSRGVKGQCSLPGNLHLGPANMLLLEQELTVQVAHFDRIQIDLNQTIPHPITMIMYKADPTMYICSPNEITLLRIPPHNSIEAL